MFNFVILDTLSVKMVGNKDLQFQIQELTKRFQDQEKHNKQLSSKLAALENRVRGGQINVKSETNHGFVLDEEKGDSKVKINQDESVDIEHKISSEKQNYAEGLTIHGLTRIATGGPTSKVVWTTLVLASLATAVFISKEHWDSFLSNGSITELKMVSENEMEFPSITICNYLGIVRERWHFEGGKPLYIKPKLVNISSMRDCGRNLTKCGYDETMFLKVATFRQITPTISHT